MCLYKDGQTYNGIIIQRSRDGFSFKALVMSVKVNYAHSNNHTTVKLWLLFLVQISAILLLISPFFFSFIACCHERKLVLQKQGWGVIPLAMLSLQGRLVVNSRVLKLSTSGLVNHDCHLITRLSTGVQTYYTVGHHRDTRRSSLLLPKLWISLSQPRNSRWGSR